RAAAQRSRRARRRGRLPRRRQEAHRERQRSRARHAARPRPRRQDRRRRQVRELQDPAGARARALARPGRRAADPARRDPGGEVRCTMRTPRISRAGMTLMEVVLGMSLFCAFASSAFLAIEASAHSYRTETTAAHLDFLAHQALDDVCDQLRAADFASITPPPAPAPSSASSLDYQDALGFKNGAVEWGPVQRLAFEQDPSDPQDGVDNDGDGLIDEGRLVWIENPGGAGRRTVLCSQVASSLEGEIPGNGIDDNGNGLIDERGFCIEYTGTRAVAWITLE